MTLDTIRGKGDVEIVTEWRDGRKDIIEVPNSILLTGRRALAQSLANSIGDSYSFFITRMVFGDGGTLDGVKRYVNSNRNGLFGVTRLSKPVLSTLDTTVPAQVIFTSSIRFDEAVGVGPDVQAPGE
jgi:hypothetical protein